jgi:hypothetical protein
MPHIDSITIYNIANAQVVIAVVQLLLLLLLLLYTLVLHNSMAAGVKVLHWGGNFMAFAWCEN